MQLVLSLLQALAGALSPTPAQVAAIYEQIVTAGTGKVRAWVLEVWGLLAQPTTGWLSVSAAILSGTYGLSAAHTERQAILAAIAAITPTPAAPPPSAAQNAQAVWSYDNGGTAYRSQAAWFALENTYTRVVNMMHGWAAPALRAPGFYLYTPEPYVGVSTEYLPFSPEPDWSTIGQYATVLAWLTATEIHFTWEYDTATGYTHSSDVLPGNSVWYCTVREDQLAGVKQEQAGLPPVWPGLANVTLGTPVALAPNLTITTPMHGVVIEITGVAAKYNSFKFSYDGLTSYRKLGALTFLTDRGDAEIFQVLSFELAVYCPAKMAQAASVKLECATGTTGTITPWLHK